jgi:hypothetical protein
VRFFVNAVTTSATVEAPRLQSTCMTRASASVSAGEVGRDIFWNIFFFLNI